MTTGTGALGMSMDALIGQRMIERMATIGMTQGQLADRLGLTQTAISRKLRGQRPWFTDELMAAAAVLDLGIGELFGEPPADGEVKHFPTELAVA